MAISADDVRHLSLSLSETELLCPVAKALASPIRARMLALLSIRPMNVNELAESLTLPVSTAALNVRHLEDAGLISTEIQPGIRGAMKLCSRKIDSVSMRLIPEASEDVNTCTLRLPIGCYSVAERIAPSCGLVSDRAWIGEPDMPRAFYHPEHFNAQMLWFSSGELEYRFSFGEIQCDQISFLEFSMELSTGTALTHEATSKGPSIYTGVNDRQLGTWQGTDECGRRRGRLNPSWWSDTASQFGTLKTWRIQSNGCFLDGEKISNVTLSDLHLDAHPYISFRIGIPAYSAHHGGLNLFGEKFGDFTQGIVMRVGYA